jgi:hypothetical protein
MALTLLESRKIGDGEVIRNAVIEEFVASSDLLQYLPFENIQGGSYSYNREDKLPGVGFRGINESYSEGTGVLNPQVETLSIAGGDLDVDNFILDTQGAGVRSVHEMQKVKALSLRLTRELIKGDSRSNPRVIDGLQSRLTGTQLLSAGNTAGGDALSLTMLDDLIDLVDSPTAIVMNKRIRNKLSAASRQSGIGGFITFEPDQLGQRAAFYGGLPILIADYDEQSNLILPFTEANPGGGTPASCSVYVTSMREGMLFGIQGPINGQYGISVKDMGELETKPVMRTRVEWYCGMAMTHGRAAARLQGIKDTAVVV